MIAKGTKLQTIISRKFKIDGAFHDLLGVETDSIALHAFDIEVVKAPPKSSRDDADKGEGHYRAGAVLRFSTALAISTTDNIGFIKYPIELYRLAVVSGPSILDKHDGHFHIDFHAQLLYNLDISELSAVRIYINSEV